MVPDQIEGRATARLKEILQKKTMWAGGKPVSPVFGTLTHVVCMCVKLKCEIEVYMQVHELLYWCTFASYVQPYLVSLLLFLYCW